jgi:DNA ligase D-like protein (predicted 3'-phosphoesterase)
MSSKLSPYKSKRNLKKSGEPKAILEKTSSTKLNSTKKIFVIQEHHASHLHWDFRLEMNGTLKSWAVPKEPPLKEGIKRLAIQVEDHPLEYAKFHGEIKEGYGKGTVKIWDNGTYELKNKDEKMIEVILKGKKLNGKYVLLKTKYGSKPDKSWLLFKV